MSFGRGDRVIATNSLGGTYHLSVPRGTEGLITAESVSCGSYTVEFDNGHSAANVAQWYRRKV
ncbi:MAG: hypothetical protein ACR2P2_00370 [Nakamurella sp.]